MNANQYTLPYTMRQRNDLVQNRDDFLQNDMLICIAQC